MRSPAWYALRRTLPTWSFEENLRELVDCAPRYGIDEVIVKVDTEEFSHGQPPLEWVRAYLPKLEEVRDALAGLGVRYSLNPWITVGHNDRGRDSRLHVPGLGTMVGHDGTRATTCACPLDPIWRAHVGEVWSLYAGTGPHVLWVEDDIRTWNHRPVEWGCFCKRHLERFAARAGAEVTREELVGALLAAGPPHPWRELWLDLQAEVMIETARFLAETVHARSPETRLGLMSSGPRRHALEGRDWPAFAEALADGQPLVSRPPMGNYSEGSLRGFYSSHDSIKLTRHCLPDGTLEQTEVENVPFTLYSKSATFTFVEMAISFAYGSDGVTMNLFDHAGTPMEADPTVGRMLGESKPYLAALARAARGEGGSASAGRCRGVRLLFSEREARERRLAPGAPFLELAADGAALMEALEAHGIPTTYSEEAVAATSGQTLRAVCDAEIERLLGGGLLLDATAARILLERGFGDRIGLASLDAPRHLDTFGPVAAERFDNARFGGSERTFLTATVPDLGGRPSVSAASLREGAEVVSRWVDPDAQALFPACMTVENDLGGRVAVLLYDLASAFGVAWCHPERRRMLQGIVDWLARGAAPLLAEGSGAWPLAVRRDLGGTTLLALFNLALDPYADAALRLHDPRTPAKVRELGPDGAWRELVAEACERSAEGALRIRADRPVGHERPFVVELAWAED